jgi:two-component system chemotaxis response regulator CheB
LDYSVVVIGGSAGSLAPLQRIVAALPEDLPAAIFVTTHVPADAVSAMPHILSRSGQMFATHAIDRAPISPGRIVVAPPNFHLAIEDGAMRVLDGARENGQRPSIDVLFRSAANARGNMVCGVLLSGTLDDGVAGLQAIRKAGGETLVQDPADALFADMPRNALTAHAAQRALPAELLGDAICEAVEKALSEGMIQLNEEVAPDERNVGDPSCYTCPSCGGVLWEAEDGETLRFRCHTGHAYNVNAILSEQKSELEDSLWTALRVLQERVKLLERLARRAKDRGDMHTGERFLRQVEELQRHQSAIRKSISQVVSQNPPSAS